MTPDPRDATRLRVVRAAAELLARDGRDAVTTRAVAAAAGLQPPAIYRLFGDKEGLLDAVVAHEYSTFLETKRRAATPADPVADLRAGWDLAVEFGTSNPELYAVMHAEPSRHVTSPDYAAGMEMLLDRVRRLAAAGHLRVSEALAVDVIQATAQGAVLRWLALPPESRTPALLEVLREAMIGAVTTEQPVVAEPGSAGAATALRASLAESDALSPGERTLLTEWLDRIVTG